MNTGASALIFISQSPLWCILYYKYRRNSTSIPKENAIFLQRQYSISRCGIIRLTMARNFRIAADIYSRGVSKTAFTEAPDFFSACPRRPVPGTEKYQFVNFQGRLFHFPYFVVK